MMLLITVIVFCEKLEQMNDNSDQSLIIGVLSKLLPFFVNDKGEKSYGDRVDSIADFGFSAITN